MSIAIDMPSLMWALLAIALAIGIWLSLKARESLYQDELALVQMRSPVREELLRHRHSTTRTRLRLLLVVSCGIALVCIARALFL